MRPAATGLTRSPAVGVLITQQIIERELFLHHTLSVPFVPAFVNTFVGIFRYCGTLRYFVHGAVAAIYMCHPLLELTKIMRLEFPNSAANNWALFGLFCTYSKCSRLFILTYTVVHYRYCGCCINCMVQLLLRTIV
jgi:hypothetical protein